ncbi:hypothetical protein BDZ97DRAFT_1922184 [Flammula alnicola]|nr:hypothetical protein BDZ97DRAFT_1922184 [Flammula alnicola]
MPPAHTRIYPPVFPDQSNPPPGHPTPRMDAERIVLRWLIVGVIIIISIAVLRAILRYRPWEDFVRADDLETDTPTDLESVLGDAQYLGHYRDVPNQPTLPVPGGITLWTAAQTTTPTRQESRVWYLLPPTPIPDKILTICMLLFET